MTTSDLSLLIPKLVSEPAKHARWLNTLSLMENCGARKIAASMSDSEVSLTVLKHAAEEARHAFYLKAQLGKLPESDLDDYRPRSLLAARRSKRYLDRIDIRIARILKEKLNLNGARLRYAAYLLVTYAIEVRAQEIYPLYQSSLEASGSPVQVKMILAEESEHLREMEALMKDFFGAEWQEYASQARSIENETFIPWVHALERDLRVS